MRTIKYNRDIDFKSYEPKKRIKVSGEEIVPGTITLGSRFLNAGGMVTLWITSFLMGIKGFFRARERVRDYMWEHERVINLCD